LDQIAREWVREADAAGRDVSIGTIFVPSRRAARSLSAGFLAASGRDAVLLPRIVPLNAIDESALFFSAGLRLPPAISEIERIAMLAALIARWKERAGAPQSLGGAFDLARELAHLMDEASRWEVDLQAVLPTIVEGDLAAHWRITVEFLTIVADALPAILAEQGMVTGEARRIGLMDAQIAAWSAAAPATPVWIAGVAFATPPLTRFVKAISRLPAGRVLLSGFDDGLGSDVWENVEDGGVSPHVGFKRLLADLGAAPGDVVAVAEEHGVRRDLVRDAFLPPSMLATWNAASPDTSGMKMLASEDEYDEARAIAAALRDAVQEPGRTAALVTPDREQAQRVAAELGRLGIITEDSAGELLAETPPAVFLRLIVDAFTEGFTSVSLIALMSHPFFTLGQRSSEARKLARRLEMEVIRPLQPAAGLDHLALSLPASKADHLGPFVQCLADAFQPLIALSADMRLPAHQLFERLVEVAEGLAGGGEALWSGDAGGLLSASLTAFVAACEVLPDVAPPQMKDVLAAAMHDVRLRRPRGKDAHARVAIWGVLEARLQAVDTLFIGGLIEGVFPASADPGPWFSRPMRKAAGLPSPEDAVAEAAHDFISMVQSSETVVLCLPKRLGGAPVVPSRFVARIEALLAGQGGRIERHQAADWVRAMETMHVKIDRPRPAPVPPAWARPTTYSVSDITTLMADPYALYAKKVLRIAAVNAISDAPDVVLFGTIVHDGIAAFMKSKHDLRDPSAPAALFEAMMACFPPGRPAAAVRAWWVARLKRLAVWLIAKEIDRIQVLGAPDAADYEAKGQWEIAGGRFQVNSRADRIEARESEGGGVSVRLVDYKTGSPPSNQEVETGGAPQLIIEGAMAWLGCFGDQFRGKIDEAAYWHLSGGAVEGKISPLFSKTPEKAQTLVELAITRVPALLETFSRDDVPYLDRPHPGRKAARGIYAGVSRRAEWDVNR
jgi:ATP-dependent helicase/nuclease subunit B